MVYNHENRGIIQNRERKQQIIDYSGLKIGQITPTDIDGFIEYKNKAIILFEYKLKGAVLPYGQKIALQRLADNSQLSGKESLVIICEHNVYDCKKDIVADKAIVRDFYYNKRWYHDGKTNVKDKVDNFINYTLLKE